MKVGVEGSRYFDCVSLGLGHSFHQTHGFEFIYMDFELFGACDQL